jgi:hypothetical protein
MSQNRPRQNLAGFDLPCHRDWLFVSAVLLSTVGGIIRLMSGDMWWQALASVARGSSLSA